MRRISFLLIVFLVSFTAPAVSHAMQSFDAWLAEFRNEAARAGISAQTLSSALSGVQPVNRVIELDRKQPEGKLTFAQYRERVISAQRINQGRAMMRRHADALKDIEAQYGVAPQYIVALWGIETSYGANTGGFDVIPALATLAWEGRRGEFFTKELINALKIVDQGHIPASRMKGSWAGALGQNQFMPSSFHNFAVDHDGDGHKDIWGTLPDVFASSANYLKKNGWREGERWGRRVVLPPGFSSDLTGREVRKTLMDWQNLGVRLPGGGDLPHAPGMKASVIVPDGLGGPAFLAYDNYNVIMAWNRSVYFATSVGLLADAIATR